jgi:hypothetical protein
VSEILRILSFREDPEMLPHAQKGPMGISSQQAMVAVCQYATFGPHINPRGQMAIEERSHRWRRYAFHCPRVEGGYAIQGPSTGKGMPSRVSEVCCTVE